MTHPFAPLMEEHRLIDRVNDAFEAWADRAVRRGDGSDSEDREELLRFVGFLQRFVDTRHHDKEEATVFRVMREHGLLDQKDSVRGLIEEHEQSRTLLFELERLAHQPDIWTVPDRQRLLRMVRSYVALMYRHTTKEDTVVFPLAKARLPSRAMAKVRAELGVVDDDEVDPVIPPDPERELGERLAAAHRPVSEPRFIPGYSAKRTATR